MKLSEICIRRPVLSWVMTFILILLGLVGFSRLTLQHMPKIERPYVTIESNLNGASPEVMESQVTRVIEEAVSGIEGIVSIESVSTSENSKVSVEFGPGRKIDEAINDVRDRLAKTKNDLPREMEDPTLTRSKQDDRAVMTIALTSSEMDTTELSDYAKHNIQNDLESIEGVSRVEIVGGGLIKMRLKLDPAKMSAYNISVLDVVQAIRQQNVEQPAGKLVSEDREFLVTTVASSSTPEEFALLPIAHKDGRIILLKDIGKAEQNTEERNTKTRFDGMPGVSIGIYKQSTANPIDLSRLLRKQIPIIQERLPGDLKIKVGSDEAKFIEQSIFEVYKTIFEATFLVILVVFFFLRSARAAIIPLVTIPVSLIGTFFFMYILGFTINTLTLMSMVLAIGLVVDDAIVVLENIYRRIEEGEKPYVAAVKGIREISFAVIAMTLTLAAVYTPLSLIEGMIGKMFTEFAITLAISVIISGFAALTLSPMMCSRLLGHDEESIGTKSAGWWIRLKEKIRTDIWLDQLEEKYSDILKQTLERPYKAIAYGFAFAVIGTIAVLGLPRQLKPNEDKGKIYISGQANPSSTIEFTDKYVKQIDDILATYPEIVRRVTTIKNPNYDIMAELSADRSRSTDEVTNELRKKLAFVPGVSVKFEDNDRSADVVQFVVGSNGTLREVKENSGIIVNDLLTNSTDVVSAVLSNKHPDTEEYTITIDRKKASSLGIEPGAIAESVQALVKGRKAGTFKRENRLYDVMVEVMDEARKTPADITNLFMKSNNKEQPLVPIAELVNIHSKAGASEIYRFNKLRAVSMSVLLKNNAGVNEGIAAVNQAKENLPKGTRLEYRGETKSYIEESYNMILIFILAIAFIYFVLAAQFESWIDPFIIMLSVPLSLAGAGITLALIQGGTLNIYSEIGLVSLIGLITKHGILIVEFANQLRDQHGWDKFKAVIESSKLRLRPILMTTFAMVLGAIPLAIATGAGSESRRQIGWVIVGGMSIGTAFTLFVLPAIYLILSKTQRKKFEDVPI